ncbi:hypothetical protein [Corallococcus sp. CA049B]|uniref:hypothetical protein n=1 Tax=Corallococcus sp. CA049B TaxID=2316730 RepID=UPI001F21CAF3|nr:hypothetical protein [Corallococcus sp. CA049B]
MQGNINVWRPGAKPRLPHRLPHQMGRPRTRYVDESGHRPSSLSRWRAPCLVPPFTSCVGGKETVACSPRALPPCESTRRSTTSGASRQGKMCGCWWNGRAARQPRRSITFRPCLQTQRSRSWFVCPSYAGEWSATIRS